MCQRSNSSAKEVHRGRQLKRIGSSNSAAAAAAAVAAAGAETSNEEQFYYRRTHGPVYTVGSDDPGRIEETNEELIKMLNEDEMCDAVVMVFCQEAGVAWCDDGG